MTGNTIDALRNLYASLGGNFEDVENKTVIPDLINALAELEAPAITVAAEEQSTTVFGIETSTLQSADTAVSNGAITGTLSYVSSGVLATDWGAGNFLVLKLTCSDWSVFDKVMVGLDPSVSSGLVDIKNDDTHNGVFKITDKNAQKFVVHAYVGTLVVSQTFDLSGLTCNNA